MGVGVAGAEDGGGKIRLIDAVGKMLGLERHSVMLLIGDATLADIRAVKPVRRIDLDPRLGREHFHRPAACGVREFRRGHKTRRIPRILDRALRSRFGDNFTYRVF